MTRRKKLTFEQIAPNWAKALRSNPRTDIIKDEKGKLHLLSNYACCIVGESHGFNGDYYYGSDYNAGRCAVCCRLSEEFDCTITDAPPTNYEHVKRKRDLNDIINEFVTHWNKKHI